MKSENALHSDDTMSQNSLNDMAATKPAIAQMMPGGGSPDEVSFPEDDTDFPGEDLPDNDDMPGMPNPSEITPDPDITGIPSVSDPMNPNPMVSEDYTSKPAAKHMAEDI